MVEPSASSSAYSSPNPDLPNHLAAPSSYTTEIPFSIDTSADDLLSTPRNTEEELSIPRETIADVVGRTRLHAELLRPIRLGAYNDLPAMLLCLHLSFQRLSDGWLTRVRAATIEVEFLDAPRDESMAANPSIGAFYPVQYEGPTSYGQVVKSTNASVSVAPPSGSPNVGTGSVSISLFSASVLFVCLSVMSVNSNLEKERIVARCILNRLLTQLSSPGTLKRSLYLWRVNSMSMGYAVDGAPRTTSLGPSTRIA